MPARAGLSSTNNTWEETMVGIEFRKTSILRLLSAGAWLRLRYGRRVRWGHDQRHDLHRPADRRAAAAPRARLREADRRQGERHHRAVLRPLPEAADRLVDRHQLDRRRRLCAAVDGRLCDAGPARGPVATASPRTPRIKQDDIAPFFREFSQKFNGKTYMLTLDGDFQMAYYRTDVAKELGLEAAKDLGRLSRLRQGRATART